MLQDIHVLLLVNFDAQNLDTTSVITLTVTINIYVDRLVPTCNGDRKANHGDGLSESADVHSLDQQSPYTSGKQLRESYSEQSKIQPLAESVIIIDQLATRTRHSRYCKPVFKNNLGQLIYPHGYRHLFQF